MMKLTICISLALISAAVAKPHHHHDHPRDPDVKKCFDENQPGDMRAVMKEGAEADEKTRAFITCIATAKGFVKDDNLDMDVVVETLNSWNVPEDKQEEIKTCLTSEDDHVDAIIKCKPLVKEFLPKHPRGHHGHNDN